MNWKVKSARVKGSNLVIVAEREIPLSVLGEEKEVTTSVSQMSVNHKKKAGKKLIKKKKSVKHRKKRGAKVFESEEDAAKVFESEEDAAKVFESPEAKKALGIVSEEKLERMQKVQDGIEEMEMKTDSPVSKLKGQKGMILASVEAGNETLADISKETNIGMPSVSHHLSWLVKNGFCKRTGRGQYEMTARGENYLRKLKETEEKDKG